MSSQRKDVFLGAVVVVVFFTLVAVGVSRTQSFILIWPWQSIEETISSSSLPGISGPGAGSSSSAFEPRYCNELGEGEMTGDCEVCEYEDPRECVAALSPEDCKAAHKDCTTYMGRCMSRFEEDCLIKAYLNKDKNFCLKNPFGEPNLSQCTSIRHIYSGHSEADQCAGTFSAAVACFDIADSCIDEVDYINTGCRSMADLDAAEAEAERVRKLLKPGQRLLVTGNQLLSSEVCTTEVKFLITCDGVEITYGPCHPSWVMCHGKQGDAGRTAWCTDEKGKVVQEVCCADNRFHRGTECPKSSSSSSDSNGAIGEGGSDPDEDDKPWWQFW
jgi:hypothetical protein